MTIAIPVFYESQAYSNVPVTISWYILLLLFDGKCRAGIMLK